MFYSWSYESAVRTCRSVGRRVHMERVWSSSLFYSWAHQSTLEGFLILHCSTVGHTNQHGRVCSSSLFYSWAHQSTLEGLRVLCTVLYSWTSRETQEGLLALLLSHKWIQEARGASSSLNWLSRSQMQPRKVCTSMIISVPSVKKRL